MGRLLVAGGQVRVFELRLSRTAWFRLLGLACIGVLLWAGYHFLLPAHGVRDVYEGRCGAHESIVVKSSAYSHPLDFELGDATGYGLFLRVSGYPRDIPIYDDAFSERDYPLGFPATYVGWDLAGEGWNKEPGQYRGPVPTNEFAPMPQGLPSSQARIFELPSGTYSRDATPPATEKPLLMNIFLPSEKISADVFIKLADCLALHQADINRALVRVRADFPYRSRHFYRPLRLGGMVRGLPPWSDPGYVNQIRSLYDDTKPVKALPDAGLFTLYKGQSANGLIDGKQVRLSILPTGETQWLIDGAILPDEPTQKDVEAAGLRDVASASYGLEIGNSICRADKMDECSKSIEHHSRNNDGSTTFWIWLREGDHTWVNDVASFAAWHHP
jgi:hypothetical protein